MLRFRTAAKNQALAAGFLAGEAILLCAATIKHPLWRDEAQAWLIARDSPTITALIHNLRYEGHPPLWHLLLFCFTRFTWNPLWMKVLNLGFALLAAAIVLFSKRLLLGVRVGVAFSYFILFEYGTIARNYMVGIALLLAAACLLLRAERSRVWTVPLLLALAALTSLPALILAVSLFCVYLVRSEAFLHTMHGRIRLCRPPLPAAGSSLIFLACALASVMLIRPPSDTGVFLLYPPLSHNPLKLWSSIGTNLAVAYFPMPVWRHRFWDAPALVALPHHLPSMIGWATLVALTILFKRPTARLFFLGGSALLLLQITVSQRRTMHNLGWLFICLALAILLENGRRAPGRESPVQQRNWRPWLLGVVLGTQVASGLFAVAVGLTHPFSHAKDVAELLRARHLEQAPLVFEPDYVGSAVLAYLQRPKFYDLELHRTTSFIVWDRSEFLDRHVPSAGEMAQVTGGTGAPVLITEEPLTASQADDLHVRLLASYNDAIADLDNYYIYR